MKLRKYSRRKKELEQGETEDKPEKPKAVPEPMMREFKLTSPSVHSMLDAYEGFARGINWETRGSFDALDTLNNPKQALPFLEETARKRNQFTTPHNILSATPEQLQGQIETVEHLEKFLKMGQAVLTEDQQAQFSAQLTLVHGSLLLLRRTLGEHNKEQATQKPIT